MSIQTKRKTEVELEDEAIADAVRTFVTLQARVWIREQKNRILPSVIEAADNERARGRKVDVPALIRKVWLETDGLKELV